MFSNKIAVFDLKYLTARFEISKVYKLCILQHSAVLEK